jgi:uncharacterized membrane protein
VAPAGVDRVSQGYDIPARAGWFPIVTGVQEVPDLIAGFSAPSGYGHNYAVDLVSGWAAVVPPARWTQADSARLQRHLAPRVRRSPARPTSAGPSRRRSTAA